MKSIRNFFPLYVAFTLACIIISLMLLRGVLVWSGTGDAIPFMISLGGTVLFAAVMRSLMKVLRAYMRLRASFEMNVMMSVLPHPTR